MQIQFRKTVLEPDTDIVKNRIERIAWANDSNKLAIYMTGANQIALFDSNTFEKKEKFTLKQSSNDEEKFLVKGLSFSPDSTKLAVGQTNNILHVYKIGLAWGEKKSIIAKYSLQSSVTFLTWNKLGIVYGSVDGKVKLIQTTNNKIINIFNRNSLVTCLCVYEDKIAAGFLEGLIYLTNFNSNELKNLFNQDTIQLAENSEMFPPFNLCITSSNYLIAASFDSRLTIFTLSNLSSSSFNQLNNNSINLKQTVELSGEIQCISASPSGDCLLVACLELIHVLTLDNQLWKQSQQIVIKGSLLISTISFSNDGTKLLCGSINGSLNFFEIKYNKKIINGDFEITYTSKNQIAIRNTAEKLEIQNNENNIKNTFVHIFKSKYDIKKIKILKERYVVIWTSKSLIFGDLDQNHLPENLYYKQAEIEWDGLTEQLKFWFDYDNSVLINVIGELYVIELTSSKILTSVRTDFVSPHLISVRLNERSSGKKSLAYLLDAKTIVIIDLITEQEITNLTLENHIDWIELNETSEKILVRDKQLHLYLFNLKNDSRNGIELQMNNGVNVSKLRNLLNYCAFVQWVPLSDVVVAQSKDKLYIFYNYDNPVVYDLNNGAEILDIVRENNKSKIVFTDKQIQNDIELDEVLLEFDTSLHDGNLKRAMDFLDTLELNPDTESMWRILLANAIKVNDYLAMEKALAATGDLVKSQFVKKCATNTTKKCLLQADWLEFEQTHSLDDVIDLYVKLYKWPAAIAFAQKMGRTDLKERLEVDYYKHLIDTGREFEAGYLAEKRGDWLNAINLYLKSNRALNASKLILKRSKEYPFSDQVITRVVNELKRFQFFEEVGYLYELNLVPKQDCEDNRRLALQNYKQGALYNKAIELARLYFPDEVVKLEEEFGDYLVNNNDNFQAVIHYIEAGCYEKALTSAIKANDFEKAADLALGFGDQLKPELGKKIGDFYAQKNQIEVAVNLYINSGFNQEAIKLLNEHKQFTRGFKLAKTSMGEDEAKEIYFTMGKNLENERKFKDAEQIYLVCDHQDSAISMYRASKQYDLMIDLVKRFYPNQLQHTHKQLAKELELEKDFSQAELHYISANEWKNAVQMYKNENKWEDAYRIARSYGGNTVAKQIALLWAKNIEQPAEAVQMLNKHGLLHQVLDQAIENGLYSLAKSLANQSTDLKHKLNQINIKWASQLEEQDELDQAEKLYLEANRPKEAVLMYLHKERFEDAVRIAESEMKDENLIKEVLAGQAKSIMVKNSKLLTSNRTEQIAQILEKVESILLRAGRPEIIINIYKERKMFSKALQICQTHAPHLINAIKREISTGSNRSIEFRSTQAKSSDSFISQDYSIDNLQDLLEKAEQQNNREEQVKYTLALSAKLIQQMTYSKALNVLHNHSFVFFSKDCKKLVLKISIEIFAMENGSEPNLNDCKLLRDALAACLNTNKSEDQTKTLEKYLLIAHYLCMKYSLIKLETNHQANALLLKLLISLLRYTDLLRVDLMFYEAAEFCRKQNKIASALLFFNHFLDLIDAIEEEDFAIDQTALEKTDIPVEVPLPEKVFLEQVNNRTSEEKISSIKNWILKISMENTIQPSLPIDKERNQIYEASLVNQDGNEYWPCLVTGYPVLSDTKIELKKDKYAVNRDDWNQLLNLSKTTLDPNIKECIHFINRLCSLSNGAF